MIIAYFDLNVKWFLDFFLKHLELVEEIKSSTVPQKTNDYIKLSKFILCQMYQNKN